MYCIYIYSFIFFPKDLPRKSHAELQLRLTSSTSNTCAGDTMHCSYFSGDTLSKAQISEALKSLKCWNSASESPRKKCMPMGDPYKPEMILPACFTSLVLSTHWIWALHLTRLRNYKISVSSGELSITVVGLSKKKKICSVKEMWFFLSFSLYFFC